MCFKFGYLVPVPVPGMAYGRILRKFGIGTIGTGTIWYGTGTYFHRRTQGLELDLELLASPLEALAPPTLIQKG